MLTASSLRLDHRRLYLIDRRSDLNFMYDYKIILANVLKAILQVNIGNQHHSGIFSGTAVNSIIAKSDFDANYMNIVN